MPETIGVRHLMIALGLVAAVVAAILFFAPTSVGGLKCGSAASAADHEKAESDALTEEISDSFFGRDGSPTGDLQTKIDSCATKLGDRKLYAGIGLAAGFVLLMVAAFTYKAPGVA